MKKLPQDLIRLDFSENGLCSLTFGLKKNYLTQQIFVSTTSAVRQKSLVNSVMNQLVKYFRRERVNFKVKIDWSNISEFTQKVLKATMTIPYGTVCSYGEIARKIGKPKSYRAVGQALARNPIPIVIPCHRVIKSDRSLGGFAGGWEWKQRLLELEGLRVEKGKLKS